MPYVAVLLLVVIIRSYFITPVVVEGKSMEPTLYDNDFLILNKFHYNNHTINRYDVVAINYNNTHIIKRIIAKPGDTISYKDNKMYINSKEAIDPYNTYTNDFSEISIPNNYYFVMGDCFSS